MHGDERALAGFVAQRLQALSGELVGQWVAWVRSRVQNPVVESLPFRALQNHIPPVVESLGGYVINPTTAVREEILGHLRMHGQIRRDQGYDLRDVMAELDGLSHLIMQRMQSEVVGAADSYSVDAALTVFARLSAGLRAMAFVTLGVYRDTEDDRRQELARRLAEFGRTLGHELRSPLNSIALSVEVLSNSAICADDERRQQQLSVVRSAVKHAEGLIDDVDLLAMAETAHAGSRMVTLSAVLEAVREQSGARAAALDVVLDFELAAPRVAVESVVAQLTLTNLVNNAIKYSDPAKDARWVKVRVTLEKVHDTPFVVFEVSDNGIGIPDDLQQRVFQRNFRAHPQAAEGTGLGLSISQELIVERGGSIELTSEEGQGTTVRAKLFAIDVDAIEGLQSIDPSVALMETAVRALIDNEPS